MAHLQRTQELVSECIFFYCSYARWKLCFLNKNIFVYRIFAQIDEPSENSTDVKKFYKEASKRWPQPFLLTEPGQKFVEPFKSLKIKYLLLSAENMKIIETDNVIPRDWINAAYKELWQAALRIQNYQDRGWDI